MIQIHSDFIALLKWTHKFPRLRALLCGVISAIFLILAFPFFEGNGVWWLAVLIPVPLMAVADEPVIRPSRAAFYAGIGTLPAWLWTHQWMWGVSEIGTPFLMVYLMLFPALFVWMGHRVVRRFGRGWIVLPAVWVGVEFLRGTVAFTGYPWYFSAHPLIDSPGQVLAGAAGIGGVSMVGLFASALGWQVWGLVNGDRMLGRIYSIVGVLGVWIGLGMIGLSTGGDDGRSFVVGVVQSNVPQDNRMEWTDRQRYLDWMMFRELTVASARDPGLTPDVIIWPEGFVPGWTFDPVSLEHERGFGLTWNMVPRFVGDAPGLVGMPERVPATTVVDEMLLIQRSMGIPMVVGSVAFENLKIVRDDQDWVQYTNDGMFNSVFVVDEGMVRSGWYNKMHLTPFGEVMPVISRWEWLEQRVLGLGAEGMEFILSAGEEATVLEVPVEGGGIRVGAPICFEATVSGVCRELVFDGGKRRSDVLMNLTNDGWFGAWEPARRAHMLTARWRCVELGTPMVRCANTGVSCVIDRRGGVSQERLTAADPDDPKRGYLNARVTSGSGVTVFGRVGDVFGWLVFGLTVIGMIVSFVQKRSEPGHGTDE